MPQLGGFQPVDFEADTVEGGYIEPWRAIGDKWQAENRARWAGEDDVTITTDWIDNEHAATQANGGIVFNAG